MHRFARLSLLLVSTLAPYVQAAPPSPPSPLSTALFGAVGYDNNVYAVDSGPLRRIGSATTAGGAKIGTSFAPGTSVSYTTTGTHFWDANDEDNLKHQFAAGFKRTADAMSLNATTEFTQIQGGNQGPVYAAPGRSSFAVPVPRDHRDQLQNRSDLAVRYDTTAGFIRGVGKLQYFDMQTQAVAGADNYRDRYDIHAGADIGRPVRAGGLDAYLGYRRGYFYQDTDGGSFTATPTANATSQYNRFLIGADGKLSPALKLSVQAGWTAHDYTANYLGRDASIDGLYHDIAASWKATDNDELQVKTNLSRSVSSTNPASVLACAYQLGWQHTFTPRWTTTLTGRMAKNNYDGGATDRNDVLYTGVVAVSWKYSTTLTWTASLTQDWARNLCKEKTPTFSEQASFDRTVVAVGVTWNL